MWIAISATWMTIIQAAIEAHSEWWIWCKQPLFETHWILPTKNTTKNTVHCTTKYVGESTMFLRFQLISTLYRFITYKLFNGYIWMKINACKSKILFATWKVWWISLKCTPSESFPLHDTLHLVTDTWISMKVNLLRNCPLCMVEIPW